MTTQIKVLRENVIKELASLKEDNVQIADIVIGRKNLLEALKLQTQPGADILSISYGKLGWHYDYKHHAPRYEWQDDDHGMAHKVETSDSWEFKPHTKKPEPCIQFNCDHTILRFFSRPTQTRQGQGKIKALNFIDHAIPQDNPALTGTLIDTEELIKALEFALIGVALDEARPALTCVLLDCGHDKIKVVAADGYRLPICTIKAPGVPAGQILIDRLDVAALIKWLKGTITGKGRGKYYPELYLESDKQTVTFNTKTSHAAYERRDYTFPGYAKLIPKDGAKIKFIASELLQAITPLSKVAKDGSGIIRLEFSKGIIKASARSEETGDMVAECRAKGNEDKKIAFNYKYLIDFLRLMGDKLITLRLSIPSSPGVFEYENYQYTCMPMFVQW